MSDYIYNGFLWLIFFLFFGLALSGCGKKQDVREDQQDGIFLYYLNKTENGLKQVPYSLENRQEPEAAVNEILFRLSDTEDHNTDQYKPSIYEGVIINSVSVEDKTATVDFETNYQQLGADKEILLRSSIVKSLIQIDGVDFVVFTVGGSSLTGSDGKAVGAMTEDTFLLGRNDLYSQKEEVTLYYADEEGDGLVEVTETIEVSDNIPVETGMLNKLIHESGPKGTRNPLPSDLVINRTQVYNSICYVDVSSEIEEILPDIEDKVKIYAMVNTLAARGYASQVQFTVEGKPVEQLNDINHFDQPISCDYSLVSKTKK